MKQALLKALKYLLIIFTVVACLIVGTCTYFANFVLTPENMCGTKTGPQLISPNSEYKAVIYEFDCGAMDPFSTQISILAVEDEIQLEGGNVFGSTRGKRRGTWDGPYAEIEWLSQDHLLVRYISDTDIHHKEDWVKGVKISYEILP